VVRQHLKYGDVFVEVKKCLDDICRRIYEVYDPTPRTNLFTNSAANSTFAAVDIHKKIVLNEYGQLRTAFYEILIDFCILGSGLGVV